MADISKIDANFQIKPTLTRSDIKVYNALEAPFEIYGVIPPADSGDVFRRMPEKAALRVSRAVYSLSTNTAGGRVRFSTDSDYIALRIKMPQISRMMHFSLLGTAGCDLYVCEDGVEKYAGAFKPTLDAEGGYESEITFGRCVLRENVIDFPREKKMRDYTINLPSYSDVSEIYIILEEGASVAPPKKYKHEKPVVFYGSSITQGAISSRPGTVYENVISRDLDTNYINLGFSGAARGEAEMAEYIASLDMSAFVYDYDHNAFMIDHLIKTHEPFFKIIRQSHPTIPIICVSKPGYYTHLSPSLNDDRIKVILNTVNNAKNSGDNNVYFIHGKEFSCFCDAGDNITVDGCHPNDLGFWCMGKVIGKTLEKVL